MAEIYNMSFMDNATNPVDLITGIGTALPESSQYLIGNLLLISFFVIFLILAMRYSFNEVLIVDSFLTTIIAILTFTAGMIHVTTIIYPAVLLFISILLFMFNK